MAASGKTGLEAYLEQLPAGLASYPECQSKGSLIRSTLDGHDPDKLLPSLPDDLRAVVEDPPAPALWVPAVHGIALVHAVCDYYYPTEALVLAWGDRRARSLADSRLYRALLRVSGPRVIFSMTARLNRLFQKGTRFEIESLEPNRVLAKLTYPPRLHTRRTLLGTVSLSRSLIELTGGHCLSAEMSSCDETQALFESTWRDGAPEPSDAES